MSNIYDELRQGYRSATEELLHHIHVPQHQPMQPPQETTSVTLITDLDSLQDLSRKAAAPHQEIGELLPRILDAAHSPLIRAVIETEHVLPQPVKDAVIQLLQAHAQAAAAPADHPA